MSAFTKQLIGFATHPIIKSGDLELLYVAEHPEAAIGTWPIYRVVQDGVEYQRVLDTQKVVEYHVGTMPRHAFHNEQEVAA